MNPAISEMLRRYNCQTVADYKNAFKEILQEIALLGLWRSRFFEHAAFYGGTALRVLYQLDRFSEDLDFSLLQKSESFNWARYAKALETELKSFGFDAAIHQKEKTIDSAIQSAFLKANTLENLVEVELSPAEKRRIHIRDQIRIKLEIDTDPPPDFETEVRYLLAPIPFSVRAYGLPYLFAGKMHAILCRNWRTRVKGRDWYDLVWFVSRKTPLSLSHLESRMRQSGHYGEHAPLDHAKFKNLLVSRIEVLDVAQAKADVAVYLRDPEKSLGIWSQAFFLALADTIKTHS